MSDPREQGRFEGQVLESLKRIELAQMDHGTRLRELELEQTKLKTWASIVGASAAIATTFLIKIIPGIKV